MFLNRMLEEIGGIEIGNWVAHHFLGPQAHVIVDLVK